MLHAANGLDSRVQPVGHGCLIHWIALSNFTSHGALFLLDEKVSGTLVELGMVFLLFFLLKIASSLGVIKRIYIFAVLYVVLKCGCFAFFSHGTPYTYTQTP